MSFFFKRFMVFFKFKFIYFRYALFVIFWVLLNFFFHIFVRVHFWWKFDEVWLYLLNKYFQIVTFIFLLFVVFSIEFILGKYFGFDIFLEVLIFTKTVIFFTHFLYKTINQAYTYSLYKECSCWYKKFFHINTNSKTFSVFFPLLWR